MPVSGVKGFDVLLYGDSSCSVEPSVLASPPRAVMFALLDVFLYRIDPILKVTHAPSLRTLLFDRPTSGPAPEALKFAVYFTTVCSLDENECLEIIGQEKVETLARFRLATEILLSRADLLSTTDLTVLQAFIIFLVSLFTEISTLLMPPRLDSDHAKSVAQSGLWSRQLYALGNALDLMPRQVTSHPLKQRCDAELGTPLAYSICKRHSMEDHTQSLPVMHYLEIHLCI